MMKEKGRVIDALSSILLKKRFLKESKIDKNIIEDFLASKVLSDEINDMLTHQDFSVNRVYRMIKDLVPLLTQEECDDWINYFYQYALSKSFKNAVEIELNDEFNRIAEIYLSVLKVVAKFQMLSDDGSWQSRYPLTLLSRDEIDQLEDNKEYLKFKKSFEKDYVYEMMLLNQSIKGYTTLDHICGVHHIALNIARQLKQLGYDVDLGRVAGAAAGHDIGKYGCVGEEGKRVAYYHYYYSGQWFSDRGIVYIRNVAINHSTWDLELDALSVESLILIYSDFRVKADVGDNAHKMRIYDLATSFQVILDKLDNVDAIKEQRYKKVYAKLQDFEMFLKDIQINVNVDKNIRMKSAKQPARKYFSLMQGKEITDNVIYASISHNIKLLYRLRDEASLNKLLEPVRTSRDMTELRGYLTIFEDYYYYLTQKQKMMLLNFLYSKLVMNEEDIREECAILIGKIIARFDEESRKELPPSAKIKTIDMTTVKVFEMFVEKILKPDAKIIDRHKALISYSLRDMIQSYFNELEGALRRKESIKVLVKIFVKYQKDEKLRFYLLKSARVFPFFEFSEEQLLKVTTFVSKLLTSKDQKIKLRAYNILYSIIPYMNEDIIEKSKLNRVIKSSPKSKQDPAENYALFKLTEKLECDEGIIDQYRKICLDDLVYDSDIFLSNLKSATYDVAKKFQIELLMRNTILYDYDRRFYMAMHLCNLLKVSALETVRNAAGRALLQIMPHLTFEQKNDIVIELLRSLEMESYQFTKYIPPYFGKLILHLKPKELDEIIDEFELKIASKNPRLIMLIQMSVGEAIVNYSPYRFAFKETPDIHENRISRLFGLLFNGMVISSKRVNQMSFRVISKVIFGSDKLTIKQKRYLYNMTIKKIMTLLVNTDEKIDLIFFNNASGLKEITNFISGYRFDSGSLDLLPNKKIAFFPGTFDPFTLSHWKIANDIKEKGFEVLLYIDEFSWSKRTQPNIIRRDIVKKSVASSPSIYSFPRDITVNIANDKDLKRLVKLFPSSQVYLVVGSDVLLNASAYKKESYIHQLPHIIFERSDANSLQFKEDLKQLEAIVETLPQETVRFKLDKAYESISSTMIRDYIDEKRDISSLIDPIAQNYIYEKGLYQREPVLKSTLTVKSIKIETVEIFSKDFLRELHDEFGDTHGHLKDCFESMRHGLNFRCITLRDADEQSKLIGVVFFHWMRARNLHNEIKNRQQIDQIRHDAVGRIFHIDSILIRGNNTFRDTFQILLTEALAFALEKDYTYCVYNDKVIDIVDEKHHETLINQGFIVVEGQEECDRIYAVDMCEPCILNQDISSMFKEPYRHHELMERVFLETRKRLQKSLIQLYPGRLILNIDRAMIYEKLIQKICFENKVSTIPQIPKRNGEDICVPFGNIFKKWILPNTVTKTLHCEKYFMPDYNNLIIKEYPFYLDIENQIKTIKSFDRPVILVDDLLNKGYRIKAIKPTFDKYSLQIKKMIVGIMSASGKEVVERMDVDVDAAYFLPNIKVWFYESKLYPYIGGDGVWRGSVPIKQPMDSANLIYPYASASYIRGTEKDKIYELSMVALENTLEIFKMIEKIYEQNYDRLLTVERLNEVFYAPRVPEKGPNYEINKNIRTSEYIENDIELLKRLESVYRSND